MTPAKIYPFSIPAGGSFPLLVIGDYCKILTSSGPLELAGDTFGSIGPVLAGQGVQDSPFNRLVLVDRSGATNNGTILIADNAFIDDRITGDVSIIDGEKNRSISGAMYANGSFCGAVAAQFSNLQIWNPVASNRLIVVSNLSFGTTTNSALQMCNSTTQLANISAQGIANKRATGGLVPVAQIRQEVKAIAETFALGLMRNESTIANMPQYWDIKGGCVITPGSGLNLTSTSANTTITLNSEWFEEVIL